jgi:ribosomal protein S6--L-glutamate ligase
LTATTEETRVVLVHGKKPTPHSIVWGVLALLRAEGARVQTWQDAPDLSRAVFAHADLVILRSVHPATAEVAAIAADGPVVVKTRLGSRGEGVAVLERGDGWPVDGPGPWLVQDRVPGDGWDRKLFVVGPRVHGTLRRWPARSLADKLGRPLRVDAELAELALAVGGVFGLCAYGVDVIDGPDGPVIVDVNAFPGFKGVPGAVGLLCDHLLEHLGRGTRPCAS